MALGVLIAEEVPLARYLFERALALVEHEALDLLGALAHLGEPAVDLDELDRKVVLSQHCHQSLEVALAVDVSAVELGLVQVLPHPLQVHQPHLRLEVLDLVPPQVVDLETAVLEGQRTTSSSFSFSLQGVSSIFSSNAVISFLKMSFITHTSRFFM